MLGNSSLRKAFLASAMVAELAVLCGLGLLAGGWLDARLGTEPWLLLLFTFAGFGVGMTRLLQGLTKLLGDDDHSDDDPA